MSAIERRNYRFALIEAAILILNMGVCTWTALELPFWWDEGWTTLVAKTWLDYGHYGRLLRGVAIPEGLNAAPPLVALVSTSFAALGVGIFQARLPFILLSIVLLAFYRRSIAELCGQGVALIALILCTFALGYTSLNPAVLGAQVISETSMLLLFLLGIRDLRSALDGGRIGYLLCIFWLSLCLYFKYQPAPFMLIGGALAGGILLFHGQRRQSLIIVTAPILAVGLTVLLKMIHRSLIALPARAPDYWHNNFYSVVWLNAPDLHWRIAQSVALELPIVVLSAIAATFAVLASAKRKRSNARRSTMLFFNTTALSWFAWFLVASPGFPRYLAPPAILLLPSLACTLWQSGLWRGPIGIVETAAGSLRFGGKSAKDLKSLACLSVFLFLLAQGISQFQDNFYKKSGNDHLLATVDYLNRETESEVIIETYESEILAFLNRKFSFPPDEVHARANIRWLAKIDIDLNYAPNPDLVDYLVIGGFGRRWKIYDKFLAANPFEVILTSGDYVIYRHLRSKLRSVPTGPP